MKIQITGFEPFGNFNRNPSQILAQSLATAQLSSAELISQILPVSFDSIPELIRGLLANHRPDLWLMLGVAGKAKRVRLETCARNIISRNTVDNDGYLPSQTTIDPYGPQKLTSPFDTKRIYQEVAISGHEIELSEDCGGYLCNFSYYQALSTIRQLGLSCPTLFVHVPPDSSDPGGSLSDALRRTRTTVMMILQQMRQQTESA